MDELNGSVLVVVALIIVIGITVAFTVDLSDGDLPDMLSDEDDQVEIEDFIRTDDKLIDRQPTRGDFGFEDGDPPSAVIEFEPFEEVSTEIGFEYESTYRGTGIISRSGVYVVDYNNNGYEDILATGGNSPVLFENTGDGYKPAHEFDHPETRAAHFFDFNNNGYRDLLLAEYGGELVFYANERGTFEPREVGLTSSVRSPTSITSADFTGNGCLDLFVAQNGLWQQGEPLDPRHAREVWENHPVVRPEPSPGGENLLFYGDCSRFWEVTEQAGISGKNWTLATSAADFSGNGYPDIHVGNDFSADFLYENNGDGTFDRSDLGPETDRNAMSSVATDLTGNHHLDLFVTNVYFPDGVWSISTELPRLSAVPDGNNLLVNDGTGEFTDKAPDHGLHRGGWGWAAVMADFTNDGHRDVVHAASIEAPVEAYDEYRAMQLWKGLPESWEAGDSEALGIDPHESRGLVRVDFANDGRLDLVVATTTSGVRGGEGPTPFAFYENQHTNDEALQFFVRNPDGLARGADVYVQTDTRTVYRTVTARGDFLSQNSRLLHIGAANEEVQAVTIVWPDGTESIHEDLEAGNRYIVTPDGATIVEKRCEH